MFLLLLWNHFLVVQYLTTAGGSQIPQYLKGKGRKGGGMEEGREGGREGGREEEGREGGKEGVGGRREWGEGYMSV